MVTTFDPINYKKTTRDQWQTAAEAWNRWGPFIDQWLGAATEIMLDLANVHVGSRVLDVAAGAGGQTLAAARRVGPSGSVLATDISSNILDFTVSNASAAGLSNVDTRVLDGENLEVEPEAFDTVISRVGLIYFPDQQKALERHAPRAQTWWSGGRHRLYHCREQHVLLSARFHHPAARTIAPAIAWTARALQPWYTGGVGGGI